MPADPGYLAQLAGARLGRPLQDQTVIARLPAPVRKVPQQAQGRDVVSEGGARGVVGRGGNFQPLGNAALKRLGPNADGQISPYAGATHISNPSSPGAAGAGPETPGIESAIANLQGQLGQKPDPTGADPSMVKPFMGARPIRPSFPVTARPAEPVTADPNQSPDISTLPTTLDPSTVPGTGTGTGTGTGAGMAGGMKPGQGQGLQLRPRPAPRSPGLDPRISAPGPRPGGRPNQYLDLLRRRIGATVGNYAG